MSQLYNQVKASANRLRQICGIEPAVAVILGTGLGQVGGAVEKVMEIPYDQIPHFPRSTVEGHKGSLALGRLGSCPVAVMQGRFHYYEGYSMEEVTFGVRVLREMGASTLVISSAAGGLNPIFSPADVMVVTDHINLMGQDPLRGIQDARLESASLT